MDAKEKLIEIRKRFNFGTMYTDEIEEYGNKRVEEVFDDIEDLCRPLAGDFGDTPIRKDYLKLKQRHTPTKEEDKK